MKDTVMFLIGIALALCAAGMMIWSDVDSATPALLGLLGVIFIGVGARQRREHRGS